MTDKDLADATYVEPITEDAIEQILIYEKPDAILPTVGGQTALDITIKLYKTESDIEKELAEELAKSESEEAEEA